MVSIDRRGTCSFTGHRAIPVDVSSYLFQRVKDGVNYLYSHDVKTFLAGGALGFDALAARAVLECRNIHRDLQLILVIPCQDQARFWKKSDVETYENIKVLADEVICLSERYYDGCMQYRNRFLIDNSSACICYLTQPKGGTAYTVTYARNKGVSVFNLAKGKRT